MSELVREFFHKQLLTRRKALLIDKAPVALLKREGFFGGNRARDIAVPGERLELRKFRRNDRRNIRGHSASKIMQSA